MFFTLEDKSGEIEVVVFPQKLSKYAAVLNESAPIIVTGEISLREEESPKILMQTAAELKSTVSSVPKPEPQNRRRLYLRVPDMQGTHFKRAMGLLEIFCGTAEVYFYDMSTSKYIRVNGIGADCGDFITKELSEVLGEKNVAWRGD